MPPLTEARKRANRKWDEAHRGDYWRCTIVFPIEEKDQVMQQAEAAGVSLSEYIRQLIAQDRPRLLQEAQKTE